MKGIVNRGSAERPNWYCRYIDIDGKRKNRPTHQATAALAEQFLAAVKARVARGQRGIAADAAPARGRPPGALTLRQLVERYLQQAAPRSKDPERYRRVLRWTLGRHVLPELGALPLPLVSAPVLEQLCERRLAQGYKPATVNSIVRNLSVLLTWGRRMELYSGRNPAAGLQRPVPTVAADYFTAAEVARLLAVARQAGPAPHALLATAVYTGMRKGELFGLRWEDVCFAPAQLRVMRSYAATPKSGRWRAIPIHPELLAILTDWQRVRPHPELVFPIAGRMGTSRELGPLPTLLRRANLRIAARPFHALRHTFASHYVMAGGNLLALQKLLGHSRFEMTQIYSHLAPEYLAGEVGRLRFLPGK